MDKRLIFLFKNNFFLPRVKSSMTISFNYHVTFPAWDLENPAIFHDVSMNFHETFYLEIKTDNPVLLTAKKNKKLMSFLQISMIIIFMYFLQNSGLNYHKVFSFFQVCFWKIHGKFNKMN